MAEPMSETLIKDQLREFLHRIAPDGYCYCPRCYEFHKADEQALGVFVSCPEMPRDEIHMVDRDGEVVAQVVNIKL